MAIRQIQSVFTLGELDPKLFARTDFEGYFKGAQKLRNTLTIPQGGATRRFGTSYVATIVDTGDSDEPITDSNEVSAVQFDYSATKSYSIIARPHDRTGTPGVGFDIYLSGALQATVTTTDYTIAQIAELTFLPYQSRVIILHEDVQPHELVRTDDTTWAIAAISFAYTPNYDFSVIDGTSYRGSSVTFTPSATSGSGVTVTAASATPFTAGHVGGLYLGGGGVLRINSVNAGGTVATGDTVQDFDGTSAIKGANSLLLESAWGDFTGGTPAGKNRGWPSRGAFFQNRLYLARTPTLRESVFASNISDYYNFDESEGTDINGFTYTLSAEIQDVVANKGMVALTSSTVEATSLFLESPITPSNIFFNVQSYSGANDVPAIVVDNQILFVDVNDEQVNSVNYNIQSSSFDVSNASILSPQLIATPTTSASYKPKNNQGEFYLLTNTDGSLAILQSLINQDVQGWTLATTQGYFKRAIGTRQEAAAVVMRSINTGTTATGDAENAFTANSGFDNIVDVTADIASASSDVALFSNEGDYLIVGHNAPFSRLEVALDTNASADIEMTVQYLSKQGTWEALTVSDNTNGFTGDGEITWALDSSIKNWVAAEFPVSLQDSVITNPLRKFWIRIQRGVETLTTAPIEDTIKLNVANRLFLETLDFDVYTDSAEPTTSDSSGLVTNLDHLIGQSVYATVNGIPEGPFFVDAAGEITVSGESGDVSVGINYVPEIIPMPLVGQMEFMQSVYQPKHLKAIYVDYYKSLAITVNGQEIPSLKLNQLVLDQAPIPTSSFYQITPMRGWDPRNINTISQDLPLPMTIIGIGYRMEMS